MGKYGWRVYECCAEACCDHNVQIVESESEAADEVRKMLEAGAEEIHISQVEQEEGLSVKPPPEVVENGSR